MRQFFDTFSTPLGEFSAAVDPNGAVIATAFGGPAELRERFSADEIIRDPSRLSLVGAELAEYFSGERQRFTMKLSPSGTPFQQSVWAILERIPFGETRTYGQLAAQIGNPGAARAIGRANATNPICLFIPCHRVIGGDGSLTGYAFGENIKYRLLQHERADAAASLENVAASTGR